MDWREQSYPLWMQTADIYNSEALGTTIVHSVALDVLADIAAELGHKKEAEKYRADARKVADAVNSQLWLDDKGYYAMYNYGRNSSILNPRAETLGESLAIIYDIASPERARTITENNPVTPFGAAIFFPQISDQPPYHNNALWPWVGAYWAIANAKAGNEEGTMEAIGSVFRPAALFATNK
ncbi:MGH1-like glycoside hydrolase domain-containing protein, partial [Muribaculum intestinale]|uniref:MGH1-like glycoside hydrolase domain-containing protein n=1 Tax=Muribaculum intestinale TaxID=1796646 RepID=UPI0026DF3542